MESLNEENVLVACVVGTLSMDKVIGGNDVSAIGTGTPEKLNVGVNATTQRSNLQKCP